VRSALAIAGACALALLSAPLAAQPPAAVVQKSMVDPWVARTTLVSFQPQKAADAPVQLDLPKKEWMALPGSGSVLLVLSSRKGDAVVLVEGSPLRHPLEASDITAEFAQIELDALKQQQPQAADFQSKVLTLGERRLVAIQYARPGIFGSERVRQYSLPFGNRLYRVSCITSAALFGAYEAVFSHIAASFTASE
jgi:hypothetical protein